MSFFERMKTLEDYEKYQTMSVQEWSEELHKAKGLIQVFDSYSFRERKGTLIYNYEGFRIDLGNVIISSTFHKYRPIRFYTAPGPRQPLIIGSTEYLFDLEEDKEDMMKFMMRYNKFMDWIMDETAKKCVSYAKQCLQEPDGKIAVLVRQLLDRFPEIFFTNGTAYSLFVHLLAYRDCVLERHVNFTTEESQQAAELLKKNPDFYEDVHKFSSFLYFFNDTMLNSGSGEQIESCYIECFAYCLIREYQMERFASVWTSEYSSLPYTGNSEDYIRQCLNENLLDPHDEREMAALTYFLMKQTNSEKDFRIVLKTVKDVIARLQNDKAADLETIPESEDVKKIRTAIHSELEKDCPDNELWQAHLKDRLAAAAIYKRSCPLEPPKGC